MLQSKEKGDFHMENEKQPIETDSPAINLLLLLIVIALLAILFLLYKSYNELIAIHELLNNNLLFK